MRWDEIQVRASAYDAWMDVCDSDHKPVYALLDADVPWTIQEKKRRLVNRIMKACYGGGADAAASPQLRLSKSSVRLHAIHKCEQLPREALWEIL